MADFSRLPGPNADLWDWQLRGLCRGKDSSLFFHPEGERGAARSGREVAAKEICLNCPVQIPCVEHALRVREPYGVWGGMTEDEREEHYARQKLLVRAQAARAKAAKVAQAQLKEQLLQEKEAQREVQLSRATADATAQRLHPQPSGHAQGVGAQPTRQHSAGQAPAAQESPGSASAAPQPVRAAAPATGRTAGDLAETVAAVKRARKSAAQPAAKKAAPSKTSPRRTAPKNTAASAPKAAAKTGAKSGAKNGSASAKPGAKRLAKV